ncbi:hypothetical protein [Blautia schinkii]|uniref:hypothetical protein n=1 Tax=Blautia schinkii TaxID=180164 RepID=UPI00156D7E60|nr:hypothetical protein [Blautia schinkii]NSK34639.1 hypothetical protein [Blautia schinkii]NSK65132.1 hypothetical protein [Blautia schinkii]
MKKKYLAAILGVMMAATSVTACGAATTEKTTSTAESSENKDAEDTTADSTKSTDSDNSDSNEDANADADKESFDKGDSDEEDVTYGEVKSVETGKITIAVGTMKEMGGNGGTPGGEQGEAPEKPDGDNGNGESPEKPANDSIAPEKPDGDNGNGQAPGSTQGGASDGNNSQSETIELSGIQEGDIVAITTDDDGNALTIKVQSTDMGGGQGAPGGAPGGQSQGVDGYDAVNTYDSDTEVSDTSLESTGTDENAALVSSGANVTFNNVDITRNSSDSTGGDNSSFYGVGAALLATEGNAYVKGGTVTTDAAGGAGLFAYGDGTVYAADTTIKTTQDTSGGIHAAGGGKLYAWELNVETNGESAAAIRSDRGGGIMVVDGGTYTSNGEGSPAVYCTADIAVKDATLTANGSEAVCIEGLNSLHLFDCDLTGNMSDLSQNDSTWTVILYQSMSGDSEVGNSTFQMDGGTLTSQNGGVFYTTNTESDITLNTVDITYNNDNEYFLRCTGNNNERGWGESGANGADCDFTAISQDMEGDVIWDTISQLDFYMTDGSNLTGVIIDDESFAGNGGDGYCNVYVSDDSTWTVTGNSTVSTLSNAGTIVDDSGKTVTIKGTDGTVYAEGDSDYTITVDKYEETADTSDSETIASWSDYEVEKPDTL